MVKMAFTGLCASLLIACASVAVDSAPPLKIKGMVIDRCDLPEGYDVNEYEFFQGTPTKVLKDHDVIDIGSRCVQVLHTPGHSPGHMCFWEKERGRVGC